MAALGETDRNAVLLRFFQAKPMGVVGEHLGVWVSAEGFVPISAIGHPPLAPPPAPLPESHSQPMKQRDPELGKGWVQIVHTLSVPTDGGPQPMLCANTEGLFRIIQSIPSTKAEPFKRWLAKVGYERIQEIEDPELATKRTRAIYKAKGYSDDWIEKRMRSIAIRDELTDEWKKRGVREHREYAILTAEISQATFGLTPIPTNAEVHLDSRSDARYDAILIIFDTPARYGGVYRNLEFRKSATGYKWLREFEIHPGPRTFTQSGHTAHEEITIISEVKSPSWRKRHIEVLEDCLALLATSGHL